MNILIIEDDPVAAKYIEDILQKNFNQHVVCGIAPTVKEAYALYKVFYPEILVMDIHLGDHTSFDMFNYIDPFSVAVIFTSSYDEYAIKAIKVEAVDYLLKPLIVNDFCRSVENAAERIILRAGIGIAAGKMKQSAINTKIFDEKVLVFEAGKLYPISLAEVVKIKSEGSYSKFYLSDGRTCTATKGIGMFEKLLKDRPFVRIHDSCIINWHASFVYTPGANAYVTLSDNSVEPVSKRKKKDFLSIYLK